MDKSSNIPNRIKQSSTCCVYCGKGYKVKTNYDKHLVLCEIVYKSKERKNDDEIILNLPSQKKMYFMLLELANKYSKMEEKLNQMSKLVTSKNNKKKINVFQWLNHISPSFTFDELVDKIIILDSDIDYLFNHSSIETIQLIFSHSLFTLSNDNIPLYIFNHKSNCFYIYNKIKNENNEDIICWHELPREKLIRFLNILHVKVARGLSEWRKKNKDLINESDCTAITYDKAFHKWMTIDFKNDATFNKIKSIIQSNMKTDITNLTDAEIQF